MGASERRNKAQKLAAYLAKVSPRRLTTQCPIGHHTVSLASLVNHINICPGPARKPRKRH